jgi:hypothetical protein
VLCIIYKGNDKIIDDMLARDVIKSSSTPWAAGVVLIKTMDGSTLFCVDYRKLNRVTVKDVHDLPRIDDSLNQMSGTKWFSTTYCCSGYWQVEVEPKDNQKSAFATRKGSCPFQVMSLGLYNVLATLQRFMETVLAGLQWDICLRYLDDFIVLSVWHMLKPKKCTLFGRKVEYVLSTDPWKVGIMKTWPELANNTELRSFRSYYRQYIEQCS